MFIHSTQNIRCVRVSFIHPSHVHTTQLCPMSMSSYSMNSWIVKHVFGEVIFVHSFIHKTIKYLSAFVAAKCIYLQTYTIDNTHITHNKQILRSKSMAQQQHLLYFNPFGRNCPMYIKIHRTRQNRAIKNKVNIEKLEGLRIILKNMNWNSSQYCIDEGEKQYGNEWVKRNETKCIHYHIYPVVFLDWNDTASLIIIITIQAMFVVRRTALAYTFIYKFSPHTHTCKSFNFKFFKKGLSDNEILLRQMRTAQRMEWSSALVWTSNFHSTNS